MLNLPNMPTIPQIGLGAGFSRYTPQSQGIASLVSRPAFGSIMAPSGGMNPSFPQVQFQPVGQSGFSQSAFNGGGVQLKPQGFPQIQPPVVDRQQPFEIDQNAILQMPVGQSGFSQSGFNGGGVQLNPQGFPQSQGIASLGPIGMAGGGSVPYMQSAQEMASKGRFGDTMLVHMNPEEVRGLASLSPTGKLTTNPETGQPEAWAFLVPLLGSWLGGAAGTALGTSSLLGSAIGSGLATYAATGDLKQGILSGLTGYGFGQVLGAAGSEAAKEAATGAVNTAAEEVAKKAANTAAEEVAKEVVNTAAGGAARMPVDIAIAPTGPAAAPPVPVPTPGILPPPTAGQLLKAPFTQPGAIMENLASRKMILPYLAESQNASIRAQEEAEKADSLSARNRRAELNRSRQNIADAMSASRYAYPRFASGGLFSDLTDNLIGQAQGYVGQPSYYSGIASTGVLPPAVSTAGMGKRARKRYERERAKQTAALLSAPGAGVSQQASLRGSISMPPPQVSYDALHVGGQGYMPGVSPEFSYFAQRTPEMTDAQVAEMQASTNPSGMTISDQFLGQGFLNRAAPQKSTLGSLIEAYAGPDVSGGPSRADRLATYLSQGNPPAAKGMAEGGIADVVAKPGSPEQMAMEQIASRVMPEEGMDERASMAREYDDLVRMTAKAILGMIESPEIVIEQFISEYGQEAFNQFRKEVLTSAVPNAQTEGMISGPGGGMDDMVPGMIGADQPVAVSPGEYIVPADVVSGLGDGSSESGARRLDSMLSKVRMDRTGTTRQPQPVPKAYMGGLV